MNFVSIGCSTVHDYNFLLPITARIWREVIGFEPVLLLSGNEEEWYTCRRSEVVMSRIKEQDFKFYHVGEIERGKVSHGETHYPIGNVAQSCRQHTAALMCFEDSDYIILSDADLWPLRTEYYHQMDPSKKMTFWQANAYNYENHCTCHMGATAATWREVMGLQQDGDLKGQLKRTLDTDLQKMQDEWPNQEPGGMGLSWVAWNFDEWNTSRRIREMDWYPDQCQMIERVFTDRLDREGWPDTITTLEGKTDTHLIRPAQSDENWPKVRQVLGLLSPELLYWADPYREEYMAGYEA